MLNESGESGRPCLVPGFRGMAFSFSSWRAGCGFVVSGCHYVDTCCLYPHFGKVFFFVMNGCWALTHASSASVEMIMWVLTFLLLMWCVMLMDLPVLNHPYELGCGVSRRCGSDPELLWLRHRPVAIAQIRPLAWEPPCAAGIALKNYITYTVIIYI